MVISGCEVPGSARVMGRAAGGRIFVLGASPFGTTAVVGGVSHVTLAGTIAAYNDVFEVFAPSRVTRRIVVRDLRSGRLLHSLSIEYPAAAERGALATAIVVKPDGAVAWIAETFKRAHEVELHTFDRSGGRVLAVGSDIDRGSLALAGSTLYWTQAGRVMSSTLN